MKDITQMYEDIIISLKGIICGLIMLFTIPFRLMAWCVCGVWDLIFGGRE